MAKWQLSKQRSPELKQCANPKCKKGEDDNPAMFWGYPEQKYCSDSCRVRASRLRKKQETK